MSHNSRFDWSGFFVHFFFGAVVGGAFGFGAWVKFSDASASGAPGLFYIGGGALFFGFIAGCFGDQFWRSFSD